jgi:hypothetical protein
LANLPPTYSEASKRRNFNDLFSASRQLGEVVAYRGELGQYDVAPHKLRGPKKGKCECGKQKKSEIADTKADPDADMSTLDTNVS